MKFRYRVIKVLEGEQVILPSLNSILHTYPVLQNSIEIHYLEPVYEEPSSIT